MRFISFLTVLAFLIGCRSSVINKTTSSESKIIESAILWVGPIDKVTWEPTDLKGLLSDKKKFRQEGNFYKPNVDIKIFGHKVLYVGMLGIDLIPGPNATLEGSPQSIAQFINGEKNILLENKNGEYTSELGNKLRLIIAPHPSLKDTSIVIGGYLGE